MATKQPAYKNGSSGKEDKPVSTNSLPATLKRLERMAPGATAGQVTISGVKQKTLITIQIPGSVAEAFIPQSIEGADSALSFAFTTLSSVLINRDNATFNIKGSELHIKDKAYESKLQGVEATAVQRVEKPTEPTCEIDVTGDLWNTLKDLTSKVKVSRSLSTMPDITVHYLFTKKTALAVAFDRFQMAACMLPNESGTTFSLTLPLTVADNLFKIAAGVSSLIANESLLYVKAGGATFSTALPSVEDTTGVPTEAVIGQVKQLREAKFPKSVTLPKADVQKFIENSRAIGTTNALVKVMVGDGKTKITLSSEGNSVQGTLPSKSKKQFDFKLDIGYMNTIVEKSGDSLQLEVNDSTLVFRTDTLIYASMLSVDDEETSSSKKKKSKDDEEE